MERNAFQLLKPLKVIQLGPETNAQLDELPSGAEVCILREFLVGNCVDISYENERYFALKNELLCSSKDHGLSATREPRREDAHWTPTRQPRSRRASFSQARTTF